ncbi:MAG: RNA methyltransferase [Chloroflexi bacterium]|nr:RNA methyltransferase [Chloroflexota bacterium]
MAAKEQLITSLQNPRVKQLVSLRDRHHREQEGLMLVEGYDELSLALQGGTPKALYYCRPLVRDPAQFTLLERVRATGAELIEVTERVCEKMAYRDHPDGWLAVFPLAHRSLDSLSLGPNPLIVVVEAIEKPGNLGAILRTADAAGVDALISCDPVTDLGNPNVVRSSKGALFSVPVAEATSADTLAWLRAHGIKTLAATPQATTLYTEVDLRQPVAIAVGAEKPGLSRAWLQQADIAVQIPMMGRVNSLNVSIAAALLIYEAVKQRGSGITH